MLLLSGLLVQQVQALDLQTAWQQALRQDATWRAAQAQYEAGLQNRALGRAGLLPQVSMSASQTKVSGEQKEPFLKTTITQKLAYDSRSIVLQMRQPILNFARLGQYRRGNALADMAEANLLQAKQQLAVKVAENYFITLQNAEALNLVRARIRTLQNMVAQAEKLFAGGEGTVTDIDDARSRLALAKADELEAMDRLQVARQDLANIVGEMPSELAGLKPAFSLPPLQNGDERAWRERMQTSNPALQSRQLAVQAAQQQLAVARSGHLPTLDLVASRSKSESESVSTRNQQVTQNAVGLQLSVPLYAGGYVQADIRQAQANLEQTQADKESVENQLETEVARQFRGANSGETRVKALQEALQASERTLHSTEMGFKAGVRSRIDILNAEEQLYRVRVDLSQARLVHLLSRFRLLAAAGILADEDIASSSQYLGVPVSL